MDGHARTTAFAAGAILVLGVVLAVEQPAGPTQARAEEVTSGSAELRATSPDDPVAASSEPLGDPEMLVPDRAPARWGDDLAPMHQPAPADAGPERSPEGWVVAAGATEPVGSGPVVRFTVEVEPATGLRIGAVERAVTSILTDARGWSSSGRAAFQRIDEPTAADIRVVVATPATVDAWCARKGLNTNGWLSCEVAGRAMLNLDRWLGAVESFEDQVALYRAYLVNHEVGHALGYDHAGCPGAGAPAPVMMQQSKSIGACVPNGWVDP